MCDVHFVTHCLYYYNHHSPPQVVTKGSDEFLMLQEYVHNTHGVTHSQYSLDVMEVFKVEREGETKRYKPFSKLHNKQLLWHGSRRTNFVGILSQVCVMLYDLISDISPLCVCVCVCVCECVCWCV